MRHSLKTELASLIILSRFSHTCCVWLTALSGAGKSMLARWLKTALREQGRPVYVLDGNCLRAGFTRDLSFSEADCIENMRRVAKGAFVVNAGLRGWSRSPHRIATDGACARVEWTVNTSSPKCLSFMSRRLS